MSIEEYFGDWIRIIDRTELNKVMNILNNEYNKFSVFPYKKDVFKAFKLCPLDNLKIIIISQDPYPDRYGFEPRATGLAFANNSEIPEEYWSPSLKILKDSVINLDIPHNCCTFDPTLESWAKQGILLLNSALTCRENSIGSHIGIWRPFIVKLLTKVSEYYTGIVYILLGNQAKSFEKYIGNNNFILSCNHPAYYARKRIDMPSSVFITASKLVKDNYGEEIKWYNEVEL